MKDSSIRTLAKTVSWRAVATVASFAVSYILSNNIVLSSSIAGSQIIIQSFLYIIHERIWNKIQWGRI